MEAKRRKNNSLFSAAGQSALSSSASVSTLSSSATFLPSLAVSSSKYDINEMDSLDFASSMPVFRRGRYKVPSKREMFRETNPTSGQRKSRRSKPRFSTSLDPKFEIDYDFDFEKFLDSTSKDPKPNLNPSPEETPSNSGRRQLSRQKSIGRNISETAYQVKKAVDTHLIKSDDERKQRLSFAIQRKKDRKDELNYNGRHRRNAGIFRPSAANAEGGLQDLLMQTGEFVSLTSSQQINRTASVEQTADELKDVYDQYIGSSAIIEFHTKFKEASKLLERYPNMEDLPPTQLTPRSLYLRGVSKSQLLPRRLLIRKQNEPLAMTLAHHGLGDERMAPVVEVIEKIPALRCIDFSDNRLTDKTLIPFTNKLEQLQSLTYLDLSYNKIDESSKTLQKYLMSEDCRLRSLILNGADVDDQECVHIANAISKNKSLHTLSLSKNLIGAKELLNVLYPDMITGGEALGQMLKENKTLTKLDLSWNSVRLDSAIALAKSLEENEHLQTLLLSYNSLGDMPSQVLGKALKVNKSLTELDLESNAINPKAATVLANAISFNETLIKLNINGNTLGKIGAQALVAAIQRSSTETRKLEVSFVNCDCNRDDENIFSAASPHGTWKLNLSEPYGQMVAAECLYLANHKAGCRILRLIYNGAQVVLERQYVATEEEGETGKMKKFKLEEFYKNSRTAAIELMAENFEGASLALNNLISQFGFRMQEEQRIITLKKTLELWQVKSKREGRDDLAEVFLYEFFYALFILNDTDMSGTMDIDEFLATLSFLGKTDYDRDAAQRLMGEYDRDDSGTMDANEFGTIMLNEFCRTEIPRGELVDVTTGKPWEIPITGNCVIQLSYQCDVPTVYDIGADHGIDNIIKSIREAKTDEQRDILFQNTTSSPYFFLSFDQAQLLFEEMQQLNRLPLDLLASILPSIVNEEQAIKFIDTNLNELGKFAFRCKIGQLYNIFVGLYTGHYSFDLRVPSQRNTARRLGAVSVTEGKTARQASLISSQKGNYSNFRNEKLGGIPVDITGRWFAVAANSNQGKVLHCDYVSTSKPRKGQPAMSDVRFEKLLAQLQLDTIKKVWDRIQLKELAYLERQQQFMALDSVGEDDVTSVTSMMSGMSNLTLASSKPSTANNNSHHNAHTPSQRKTGRLSSLTTMMGESKEHQQLLHTIAMMQPLQTHHGFPIDYLEFPELMMEAPLTFNVIRDSYTEYLDTCHHYYDIYPEERMRDVSRPGYNPNERPTTPEEMKLAGPPPNRTNVSPIYVLAYRKLLELQIMMPNVYITIQQLIAMLECFPPEEGYLRIQLIQAVFSHITDLENMYLIIDNVLTPDERNEVFHRIGIMNLMDPMKPDRLYRLDLRRYDHREFVKILVALAIAEPGENWENTEYRWGKYDEPVPGWSLPATWCAADDGGVTGGPRNHGWLKLSYRSYGNGCFPVFSVRKNLRKRTLAGMKRII